MTSEQLAALHEYSACDISDALLKLKVPSAGFISDLHPYAPNAPHSPNLATQPKVIGPAFPVLFAAKDAPAPAPQASTPTPHTTKQTPSSSSWPSPSPSLPPANIPPGTHYVDLTPAGHIPVLAQPPGQKCAVLGGIMAARMRACGARGVVVGGRIRDLGELRSLDFPVFAHSTSTVGTAAEAVPHAINVEIEIGGTLIHPGDTIFCDALEGTVVIPAAHLAAVLAILPEIVAADEHVLADVKAGVCGVKEAFGKYRGKGKL
ncbi:MAG: hypothetical protein M1819_005578 [Sarea resinae]|nr:MAG: hypothetical protein M1819_005578 [Sarea resinae]